MPLSGSVRRHDLMTPSVSVSLKHAAATFSCRKNCLFNLKPDAPFGVLVTCQRL